MIRFGFYNHIHRNIEWKSTDNSIVPYFSKDKKQGGKLYKHLRNKGRKYRKRGSNKDSRGLISNRLDIDQRPGIVDKKERIGDLEIDLIIPHSALEKEVYLLSVIPNA